MVTRDVDVALSEISITANEPVASLDDIAANAVKMYPNPAKGVLNISTTSNEAIDVSVYDLLGKQVLNVSKVQTQLNISSLTPGMYFVKMKQGACIATKHLLVN